MATLKEVLLGGDHQVIYEPHLIPGVQNEIKLNVCRLFKILFREYRVVPLESPLNFATTPIFHIVTEPSTYVECCFGVSLPRFPGLVKRPTSSPGRHA